MKFLQLEFLIKSFDKALRVWSENMVLKSDSIATLTAVRVAKASAIKGDVISVDTADLSCNGLSEWSLKPQPKPAFPSSFHDASVKHAMVNCGGTWWWLGCRLLLGWFYCDWAFCHSFALVIARKRASVSEMRFLLKTRWLRDVQIVQKIHGARGPSLIPVGGRQTSLLTETVPSSLDWIPSRFRVGLNGVESHTF